MTEAKISTKQLRILLFFDTFGTGVITLPRVAAEFAGNDGWLLTIGATAFALVYAAIINLPAKMFPNDTLVGFSRKICGKPAGVMLGTVLAARLIFATGIELRLFGEIVGQTMLYRTPRLVTCGVMCTLAAYLIFLGYETRSRFAEILIIPAMAPLAVLFISGAAGADFSNLLPAFRADPMKLLAGSFYISFAFRGAELALLVYPLTEKPKEVRKGMMQAITAVGAVMLLTTIIALVKFGAEDAKAHLWPLIQMTDTISLPGGFLERLDALILSLWIISVLISISAGIFFPSYILREISGAAGRRYILPVATAVFAVCLLPANAVQAWRWLAISDLTAGLAFMVLLPITLFVIARLRGIGGVGGEI